MRKMWYNTFEGQALKMFLPAPPKLENKGDDKMDLKVPPYDVIAEQSVLGACLIDNQMSQKIVLLIKPSGFYREEHAIIFQAINDLVIKKISVDIINTQNQLTKDQLKEIGGIAYLARLADSVPNSANAPYYAKIIKEASIKRNLIKAGGEISELGFEKEDSSILIHKAKDTLNRIKTEVPLLSTAERTMDILKSIDERPPNIEIGITKFNESVKFRKGDLVLIEAQRKNGKTTFAMNLLLKYLKSGYKCMLATYEMPTDTAYIPLLARIYAKKHLYGKDAEIQQVVKFLTDLGERFYTLPENTYLEDFETSILDFIKEHKIDFIFVDYDQLVKTKERYKTEERRVSDISRTLKGVAMEGNCVVILLSQLNKQGEGRWSGEKENDASVVIRLEKDPVLNEIKVWVPYNRYGKSTNSDNSISLEVDWERRLINEEISE